MDVLRGKVSGQRFQDKVVLIGAYAPSLRLYIVYELVEEHQGAIWVKSQVGEYTEFEVVLPKCQLVFEGERE